MWLHRTEGRETYLCHHSGRENRWVTKTRHSFTCSFHSFKRVFTCRSIVPNITAGCLHTNKTTVIHTVSRYHTVKYTTSSRHTRCTHRRCWTWPGVFMSPESFVFLFFLLTVSSSCFQTILKNKSTKPLFFLGSTFRGAKSLRKTYCSKTIMIRKDPTSDSTSRYWNTGQPYSPWGTWIPMIWMTSSLKTLRDFGKHFFIKSLKNFHSHFSFVV